MPLPVRLLIAVMLLGAIAFCVFGFLATFEPPGWPELRVVYGGLCVLFLADPEPLAEMLKACGGRSSKMTHKKPNLPTKICPACKRSFAWRKKWEKVWEQVCYCSEACKKRKRQGETP